MWDIESLGIRDDTESVHDSLFKNISFENGRYTVQLPFRKHHKPLPDNYELSLVHLNSLYKRLQREPPLLNDYNEIIKEQINDGIVERVTETDVPEPGEVYFIPHQAVIQKHAASTRLRIVFDATSKARSDLASLNECLFTGPSLSPEIMNVLIRFRAWKFGLVTDVRKAFHQIQIDERHRNFLHFIWLQDILRDNPKLLILRFQRVIFGVNSSPFLLNGTLDYHISKYFEADPEFARKL